MNLHVSEVFSSLQGEGPTAGKPAVFIRLSGCNLDCGGVGNDGARWYCDSKKLWQQGIALELDELRTQVDLERANHHNEIINRLVITGGEPLLQSKALEVFLFDHYANIHRVAVEVETNCTIAPPKFMVTRVNQWNCSPKLSNSGMQQHLDFNVIRQFAELPTSVFKFVVNNEKDAEEARELLINTTPSGWLKSNLHRVFLMPAGATKEQLAETSDIVWNICVAQGYTFSPRLQVFVYGSRTGV